jgi:nitroreductase
MMIAARALGIGSCWIGLGSPLGQVASIMTDLGVPEGCKLVACLIFGYPVKPLERTPKRVENVILNWIK